MNQWWMDTFFKSDPGIDPFYEDGSVVLFNCDCRLLIPHFKKWNVLITDPPYGLKFQSNHRAVAFEAIAGDDAYDYETLEKLINLSDSAAYAFCRWDNIFDWPKHLKPNSFISWWKDNWGMGSLETDYARQYEMAAYWARENHKWANGRPRDVIQRSRVNPTSMIHATEKPQSLLLELVNANVCETVVDVYAGSGSTLAAAKEARKKALGCELSLDYCEKIANRLGQGYLL